MMQLSGELLAGGTLYPPRYNGLESAGRGGGEIAHNAQTNTRRASERRHTSYLNGTEWQLAGGCWRVGVGGLISLL